MSCGADLLFDTALSGRQDVKGAGAICSSKPPARCFVCLVPRAPLLDGNTIGNCSHAFKIQNRAPCSVWSTTSMAEGMEERKKTILFFSASLVEKDHHSKE